MAAKCIARSPRSLAFLAGPLVALALLMGACTESAACEADARQDDGALATTDATVPGDPAKVPELAESPELANSEATPPDEMAGQ